MGRRMSMSTGLGQAVRCVVFCWLGAVLVLVETGLFALLLLPTGLSQRGSVLAAAAGFFLLSYVAVCAAAAVSGGRRARRGRRVSRSVLAADVLEPVADDSTCGLLLGAKRTTDPTVLIHRTTGAGPAEKPKPLPYADTMVGRLLLSKRRRAGQDVELNAESQPAELWDRWVDG